MYKLQKKVFIATIAIVVLTGAFPPWKITMRYGSKFWGHNYIFWRPAKHAEVDINIFIIEVVTVIAIGLLIIALLNRKNNN